MVGDRVRRSRGKDQVGKIPMQADYGQRHDPDRQPTHCFWRVYSAAGAGAEVRRNARSPNCVGTGVTALAQKHGGLAAAATALGDPSVSALQDSIKAFCK